MQKEKIDHSTQSNKIETSLDAFLNSEERVLVIRGAWGVGKTHFWSSYVKPLIKSQSLHQVAYSYVSLFGKSSLPDIRASIFQAGIPIAKDEIIRKSFDEEYQKSTGLLRSVPWLQDTKNKLTAKARLTGWLTDLARSTPVTDKYSRLIASLEYKLVSNYLVCIDDLERKGNDLSIREVMGLIDELANNKNCKIILIFNDRSLTNEEDKKEFEEYREKVVDSEIEYGPSHSQALACAFPEDTAHFEIVENLTKILNIKNIRVLRKLRRVVDAFAPSLLGAEQPIVSEFLNHAVILVWSHYMRTEALPYNFILSRTRKSPWDGYFQTKYDEISDEEKQYRKISQQINLSPSNYTQFIADYLAKGYADICEFEVTTKQLSLRVSRQNAHAELNAIWRSYTDSFAENEEEIKRRFIKTLECHADKINVNEFSAALEILHSLNVDVENLLDSYITLNREYLSSMNHNRFVESRDISFSPLRQKIAELSTTNTHPSIDEVTEKILKNPPSWSREDTEYLASRSIEELSEWMLSDADNLRSKIQSGLLYFGKVIDASDEENKKYGKIYETTIAALRYVSTTSELNKRRVATIYHIQEEISSGT